MANEFPINPQTTTLAFKWPEETLKSPVNYPIEIFKQLFRFPRVQLSQIYPLTPKVFI